MTPMPNTAMRAAAYLRMSTEHQQYSIANQSAAIQEYASSHSLDLVTTFVDRGKSGLRLSGRNGLQQLLRSVESGTADFGVLVVYDVSRWGRFQDVDESAFYEFTLKRAGVKVIYCAEPFHDGEEGPLDSLLKTLKRAMAAEYSRELSVKVSAGQRRIAGLGYRLGGSAGFGLRRMMVDPGGCRRMLLADGERKSIKTDRIILVPGPDEEVAGVREVFGLFVDGVTEGRIAARLNERGQFTRFGNRWHKKTIRDMLTNPKYVGDLAFSRTITHLRSPPLSNARDKWVYLPDQFAPIIPRELWNRAQAIYQKRSEDAEESVMLARMHALLAKHGRLSADLIDSEPGMMNSQTYRRRFGSLLEAYRRVGWGAERRYSAITLRPTIVNWQRKVESAITNRLAEITDSSTKDPKLPLWRVNGEPAIYASVVPVSRGRRHRRVWAFYGNRGRYAELIILARLKPEADGIMDYLVFPGGYGMPIHIYDDNSMEMDLHRFPDLSFLATAFQYCRLEPSA
jgi:DNA invertase Pin-like site-specific DNA recombinase